MSRSTHSTVVSDVASLPLVSNNSAQTGLDSLQNTPRSIAFVDAGLAYVDDLVRGMENTQVVIIEPGQDAIAQMSATLAGQQNLDSIQVFSHATDGALQLGDTLLGGGTLSAYRDQLQQWQSALSPDADIMLYGCNLAAGDAGVALISQLSELTGADVAASNDLTGHGGDWDLEVATGSIEAANVLSRGVQATYAGTLNVLANGSFDANLDGWFSFTGSESISTTEAFAGSGSLQLSAAESGVSQSALTPIQVGASYTFTGYAKSSTQDYVGVGLNIFDADFNLIDTRSQTLNASTDWEQYTIQLSPDAGASFLQVWTYKATSEGDAFFDSFSLTEEGGTPPPPPSGERLRNTSFENGLTNWDAFTGTETVSSTESFTGTQSLQLADADSGISQLFDTTEAGVEFTLSGYGKSSSIGYVGFGVNFFDQDFNLIDGASQTVQATDWQRYEARITAPEQVRFTQVWTYKATDDGTAFFDDLSLQTGSTPPPPNSSGALGLETGALSVDESAGNATLKVVRAGGSDGTVSVDYSTVPPTSGTAATANADYTQQSGTLTFADGETEKFITIPILEDILVEGAETFGIALNNVQGGATLQATNTAQITINDNDIAPPPSGSELLKNASFESGLSDWSAFTGTETTSSTESFTGASSLQLTAADSGISQLFETTEAGANFTLSGFSKSSSTGYVGFGVNFFDQDFNLLDNAGQTVQGNDWQRYEVTAAAPAQVRFVQVWTYKATADGAVFFDDLSLKSGDTPPPPTPGALGLEASVLEIDESAGNATLKVVRTGGSDGAVSVDYTTGSPTAGAPATANVDYTQQTGTLTFADSETEKFITIPILEDTLVEGAENFGLTLSNVQGGATLLATNTTQVTINDNDSPPDNSGFLGLETSTVTVDESAGTATLRVLRTGGSDGAVSIDYSTVPPGSGEIATANVDYTEVSGTLTFADGDTERTITIPILEDTLAEGAESFGVAIDNVQGGATLLAPRTAQVTITDNDALVYEGNRYVLTSGIQTWEQAQAEARTLGGNLVSVNTAAEEAWLKQNFGETEGFWIGLNDVASEGQFVWASGDPVTYTNWAPGEPNNSGDQDYAWMNFSTTRQWDDNGPTGQFRGIVEIGDYNGPENPVLGEGNGLKGEYFDNIDFTNLTLTRTDATVDFNWGSSSPNSNIGADTFSVRWTGKLEPRYSETYTFRTTTDDGVRLFVNNQLVIDKFIDQAATAHTGTIDLIAGQQVDIRLEYYEQGGAAVAQLAWSSASQALEAVPQSQLYSDLVASDEPTAETVIAGLTSPTAIDWRPGSPQSGNPQMFVAEKGGVVKVFENGSLLATPFIDISAQVNGTRDRGLLDLAVHPDFVNNPYIYLLFTYDPPEVFNFTGDAGPDGNNNRAARLIRVTADASNNYRTAVAGSEVVLLGKNSTWNNFNGLVNSTNDFNEPEAGRLPDGSYLQDFLNADSESHTIGAVEFGPDGALYVTNGDGASYNAVDPRAARVQDIDSLSGKVLRIDPITGQGLSDNPFFNGNADANRSKVYQLGLRNPFRMAIDPDDGRVFVGDVGWTLWEEINAAGPGANYGWPYYEGGNGVSLRTGGYQDLPEAQAFYNSGTSVTPSLLGVNHITEGINAIVMGDIYKGDVYRSEFQGDLFFNDLGQGIVRNVNLDAAGNVTSIDTFATGAAFVVQIIEGPDGLLYYVNLVNGTVGRWVFS